MPEPQDGSQDRNEPARNLFLMQEIEPPDTRRARAPSTSAQHVIVPAQLLTANREADWFRHTSNQHESTRPGTSATEQFDAQDLALRRVRGLPASLEDGDVDAWLASQRDSQWMHRLSAVAEYSETASSSNEASHRSKHSGSTLTPTTDDKHGVLADNFNRYSSRLQPRHPAPDQWLEELGPERPADADPLRRHSTCLLQQPGAPQHGLAHRASRISRLSQNSGVHNATEAVKSVVETAAAGVANLVRSSTLQEIHEQAKTRKLQLKRSVRSQITFEYSIYLLLLCFIYFVLVGHPLWKGSVHWLYWTVHNKYVFASIALRHADSLRQVQDQGHMVHRGRYRLYVRGHFLNPLVSTLIPCSYAFLPLFTFFEDEPPVTFSNVLDGEIPASAHDTALLIPCYKSAKIIGPTLEAALKVFPPHHIFVIANGNSPTPLDNTEDVVRQYVGVNHIWSPIGEKSPPDTVPRSADFIIRQ